MLWEEFIDKVKLIDGFLCTMVDDKNEYQYIRVRYKEGHLSFWKKGIIEVGIDLSYLPQFNYNGMVRYEIVSENRTPEQMYQIILNLTQKGE